MMNACATCLTLCRGVYCSDQCKSADTSHIAARMLAVGRCWCGRDIDAERLALSRKTCARCCERAALRTMRNYHKRDVKGVCVRCAGDRTLGRGKTCRGCQDALTAKDRERRATRMKAVS
jgi:hypothetical protein